jgi:cytochrome P450
LGYFLTAARTYGDIVYVPGPRLGGQRHTFLLAHPADIEAVLVTRRDSFVKGPGVAQTRFVMGEGLLNSDGDVHLRQRRLIQPAFHRQRIAGLAGTIAAAGARTRDTWQEGGIIDVLPEMQRLTLTIIGEALFGREMEKETADIGEAVAALLELFPMAILPDALMRLPLPRMRRCKRARAWLDATIGRILDERRPGDTDDGDLLSLVLDGEGAPGSGMAAEQLRDEVLTLFLAGYETMSNVLTWAWYLLAQHPAVESRLHAELADVLGDRLPLAGDMPRLSYTRQVLTEVLRLYPAAWLLPRRARHDCPIGPYTIPAHSAVLISPYVVHRDPRFFPDPGRFQPERWGVECRSAPPKYAYFPFGGGDRRCIGEPLAWLEGVMLIAILGQQWRMRLVDGCTVEPEATINLRPRGEVRMRLERRARE